MKSHAAVRFICGGTAPTELHVLARYGRPRPVCAACIERRESAERGRAAMKEALARNAVQTEKTKA